MGHSSVVGVVGFANANNDEGTGEKIFILVDGTVRTCRIDYALFFQGIVTIYPNHILIHSVIMAIISFGASSDSHSSSSSRGGSRDISGEVININVNIFC